MTIFFSGSPFQGPRLAIEQKQTIFMSKANENTNKIGVLW